VARQFGVGLGTVQLWLKRAADLPLGDVTWSDRPSVRRHGSRTAVALEDLVLAVRRELREDSILGEYGAVAIRRALEERAPAGRLPSVRTIGRILERRGALDARRRVRRPAPPPGWYLTDVRGRQVELDSFDCIDGLYLRGGTPLDVLTGISLHGGLPIAWPTSGLRSADVVTFLAEHWREVGRPGYAQFDNDARFIGGTSVPDSIGLVIRFCLASAVVPVFAPPWETGFQAAVEAFNGRWRRKVWNRVWYDTLDGLQVRSAAYIGASRQRSAARIEDAPPRRTLPAAWRFDRREPVRGRLIWLRRTSDAGSVTVLNRPYPVDPYWSHRLVRVELDIDARSLSIYAIRRRAPDDHRLIAQLEYAPPARWFR
jgi:hypothetical protein